MDQVSRRTFLKGAAVVGAGTLLLPALPEQAALATNVAKLGVFAEPDMVNTRSPFQAFHHFNSEIGRPVNLYRTYRGWGDPVFTALLNKVLAEPSPPALYLSFHPFTGTKGTSGCLGWRDIANGLFDSQIDSWAQELRQLGPTYVAFNHEMENEEGTPPLTGQTNGTACGTPADFKDAYWHFRARLEVQNALTNLTWVNTFMGDTFRGKNGGPDRWWPTALDPGYTGVPDNHLAGVDVYNRYQCGGKTWFPFGYLAGPAQQFAVGKGRRFFIGECGTVEGNQCGGTMGSGTAKAQWFNDALANMKSWSNLEASCYSDVSGISDGNYRIDTSSQSLASFTSLAGDVLFTG